MWFTAGNNLSHGCNGWKMNLEVGDIVDAQDSEEFTWWEAEIVAKFRYIVAVYFLSLFFVPISFGFP